MFEQLLFTTALGIGMYFVIAAVVQSAVNQATKGCEFCKGRINKEATVCPHCGRDQPH
jgi:hypothetical protein